MTAPPVTVCIRKVYLEITTACNLDCGMCLRRTWDEPGDSMTREAFARLAAQLRELPQLELVNFSGYGEPLTHPRFFEFLQQLRAARLRTELVTNGVLLDPAAAERLLDLELDRLAVSFDGPLQAADDPFHAESLAAVQANLRAFARRRQQRSSRVPEITLVFVASQRNINQLPVLHRLSAEFGATRILVTNLIPPTRELNAEVLYQQWGTTRRTAPLTPWNPVICLPRFDQRSAASNVVAQLCASGHNVEIDGALVSGGRMHCRFIHDGCLAIGPAGDVSPCPPLLHTHRYFFRYDERRMRAYRVGNFLERPLAEIWEGPEYRAFRERVRRFDFSPCIDCSGCQFRDTNQEDCYGSEFPRCGECLWAAGVAQCP